MTLGYVSLAGSSQHSPRATICRYSVAGPTLADQLWQQNSYEIAQEVQFRLVGSTNPNAVPSCNYETLRPRQTGTLKDQGGNAIAIYFYPAPRS